MKNRNFFKNSIAILLPISMGIGVLFGTANKYVNSASAYTETSLPTTIKLNDPDESTIRGYYADLDSLDESERKGNNLLKNLKTILSDGQKYYNYDSGDLVWKMYEITDRDWDMSPASSTTYGTYNVSTNTITNYQYGSNSTPKNNPYVRAYYMDRSQTNVVKAWGNHNQDATGINREHLWAKAEGFDGSGGAGARGDPMHLVAANGYANNIHSNHFYGYVDKTKSYTDVKDTHSTLGHNYSGYSKTYPSSSVTVFEPQDCDKGDIARAIFYMAARYNNIAGKSASQETFDADNPNLLLTNDLSKWKSSGYTSTATSPGYHGLITDLLEWNRIDKPDAYEIHRNNLLYTNFTNNRNPFIDFPEWADIAFGNSTSSANPTSDTVSLIGETKTVSSISINTNPTKTTYTEGEMFDPSGMKLNVTYSDNSTIIVSSGFTCSPNRALTTDDISVTVNYKGKSTLVSITVEESESGEDTPSGEKYSITFKTNIGDGTAELSSDNLVAQISTGKNYVSSASDITKVYSGMSGIKMSSSSVSGNFTLNLASSISNTYAKKVTINVAKWTNQNGSSDSSDIKVYLNGSSTASISFNTNLALEGSVSLSKTKISSIKITSSKRAYICGLDIEMESSSINPTSISVSPSELNLEIGESTTLSATVLPSNATNKSVSWASSDSSVVSVSNTGSLKALKPGTVTITCTSSAVSTLSATCSVTVLEELELHHISIIGPTKLTYNQGEEFDQSGLVVTAHYYRGQVEVSTEDVTDEAEISGYNASEVGAQTITVSFGGKNETFNVQVNEVIEQNTLIFDYRSQGYSNGQAVSSLSVDGFTVSFIKNNGTQSAYYTTGNAVRLYKNNDIEVTGPYKIKKIVIETSSGSVDLTPSTGTLNNGIWSDDPTDFVKLSKTTSDSLYITKIKVQYDPNQTVSAPLSSITLGGYKNQFYKGDSFSATGLIVTAHYTDGSTKVVNPTSVSTPNMTYNGDKTVTVTYTERGITATETYSINVKNDSVVSISLSGNYKTSFILGESFDYTGLIVAATWESGKTTYPDVASECTIKDYDMNTASEQIVTVIYGGKSATYVITVESSTPIGKISTIVKTMSEIVTDNEYSLSSESGIGTKTEGFSLDDCVSVAVGKAKDANGNTGSFWGTSPNINMRLYGNDVAQLTIQSIDGYKIKTVKITYSNKDNGVLKLDTENILSNQIVNVDGESITFGVSVTSGTKAGQVRVTAIEVVYEEIVTPQNYSLVTDVSDLRTGDKIVIAAPNSSAGVTTYYSLSTNRNIDSAIYGCEIDFNNSVVTPSDETELITVERNGNDLSFKLSDGKYLASTQNHGHIDLADSSLDLSARFIATTNTDGTNSIKLISENTNHNGRRLKFNYSGGSRFYRCYTTDSGTGVDPMIFKYQPQVEADIWAKDFLAKTESCSLTYWSSLASSYSQLSNAAKEEIYSVISDPSTDMNYRAQAMARYEKTLSVNKSADAFISEREVNLARPISLPIVAPNKETILIVVFALIGVSAIGGYYFIKRKKEDFS